MKNRHQLLKSHSYKNVNIMYHYSMDDFRIIVALNVVFTEKFLL